ncbi:5'-Nucleotidase domain-containing protein [Emticicia oligotrophica DSM 17448]|uniref:5'-Nucleotidase domain-containing protein n=1 Tax=Emticicia oligotrophica (strain DSM 17448 / CIP 109782 / MTCC 6937 / GPTSA100-15) TaxID=929562 RepID=A0ABM5MXI4_EMTOG|nr:bifunctional metallophosphatase/5'-nucleotidase [Emticicia oligotrophica]AFK01862.1 5'-Nucleotidase domain-containing protein [Emticicia oligotrophica DSM 17448]
MKKISLYLLLVLVSVACRTSKTTQQTQNEVAVTFLHMNDVYEISPLDNGKIGGMARVATVRQNLLKENPNTITVLSGDFLSPSVIGTLRYEGKSIKGKQMVDAMNTVGVDWVCLGNHEFDLDQKDLQERINESKFNWLNTNALEKINGEYVPFGKVINGTKVPFLKTTILNFKNASGEEVKVGMFGILLPSNKKDFVLYEDFYEAAKKAYVELKPKCDFVVALTHINKVEDLKLAEMLPDVKLLMGGHDHDNMREKIGNVIMAKADANAKTVYIHRFVYNTKTKEVKLTSELKKIDDTIAEEPTTAAVVKKWEDIQDGAFKALGLNKDEVVADLKEPLDGHESAVRNAQGSMGNMIAKAIYASAPKSPDCAFFNGGSIRVDDNISGKLTQLDVLRILPFGGKLVEIKLRGRLLEKVLQTGLENKGSGGYLQWEKIAYDEVKKEWKIDGKLLDVNQDYTIVTSDFLFSGKERNLGFFTKQNPDVISVVDNFPDNDVRNDIRKAVIAYLKNQK